MSSSKSLVLIASALLGSMALVSGCGDDDDGSGQKGKGGSSGSSSGSGGSNAGTAGSTSGTSGSAGSPTGGRGGNSGSGGDTGGGTAGRAGSSGTAGEGGAGDGGMGTGGEPPGGAGGAGGGGAECGIVPSEVEQALLERLGPLPAAVPPDPTNTYADNAAAATLGQRFFFDKAFSGTLGIDSDLGMIGQVGRVSCASCHLGESMEDHRSMPPDVSRAAGVHTRNAPGLVNSSFYVWTNWAGRFSAQWELPLPVSENPVIMNGTRLAIAHRIAAAYKAEYEAVFGGTLDAELGTTTSTRFPPTGKPNAASPGAWEAMAQADRDIVMRVFVNFGKALQAYNRLLVSRNSPFDRWMAGDCEAISESAKRGAQLFVGKARCSTCHANSHFSDDLFHNLGVAERVPATPDQGRFNDAASLIGASAINSSHTTWSDDPATGAARLAGLTNPMPQSTRGAFRTPNLRGVAETAPYMQSGQIATLEEVVDFYNSGGGTPAAGMTRDPLIVPLGLTNEEGTDLVAFLRALTGDPVRAALLMDTSAAP
jgi:cytochrome c peroxidase